MPRLPTGTVTFLFTDIEGSTRLFQRLGDRYTRVLDDHRRLLRTAFLARGGHEIETQGDAFFVVFPRATEAVAAAVEGQRAIAAHRWPEDAAIRVRMGLHTGEAQRTETGYVGIDVYRASRVCAAGHGGQILLSPTTRELVANDLPEGVNLRDLGEHRLRDIAHPYRLFQAVATGLANEFPPPRTLDILPNNLPIQLTSFIGREREKAEVKRLFTTTRLLTLTGSGGAGKTRLALEVAGEMLDQYPDGVWMVELASLRDPALVPQTAASALGMRDESGRPVLAALTDYLRSKHLLLVLDNCEHLLPTCSQLADALLRASPNLRIMATSREGLGIPGELAYRVPSLSLPDAQQQSLEQLAQYEAIRLFIERAAFSRPGFRVTPSNASAVVQVCQRLDGIPLALELAAARVKALAVEQIAVRLDDRFRLLTGGNRTALPKYHTLQAAMDWSYDLLTDPEQVLLRRLSVFAGGFQLDAAERVCSGEGVDAPDVLDLLARLIDKSLVLAEEREGEIRYRLLETVRQYGWDKLTEGGEANTLRGRHRDWHLALAEQADPEIRGSRQKLWIERLEAEHDNLRAALAWSLAEPTATHGGLRLVGALGNFWNLRAHWTEGRRWSESVLQRDTGVPSANLAKGLHWAAFFAYRQHDLGRASALGERGLLLAREAGDQETIIWLLFDLGVTAIREGDYDRADALFDEGATLARACGDRWWLSVLLAQRGVVARNAHDYERALGLHTEALALMRAVGDTGHTAYQLRNLGMDTLRQGKYDEALRYFTEGLELCRDVGARWIIEECLEGLAGVATMRGDHERAAKLYGAIEKARELIGHVRSAVDQADFDQHVASTRARSGEQPFAAAWTAGQSMTLEQAIEYALAPSEVCRPKAPKSSTIDKALSLLTPREQEVAALIAHGLTNREIATRMVITERTAESHVQHILEKLGVNSRGRIAAWAVEHGLHIPSQG